MRPEPRARRVPRTRKRLPRTSSSRSDVSDGTKRATPARRRARRSIRRPPSTRCWIDSRGACSRVNRRRVGRREPLRDRAARVTHGPNLRKRELCARRWCRARGAAAPPPATETPSRVSDAPCFVTLDEETPPPRFEPVTTRWKSRARSRPSRSRRRRRGTKRVAATRFCGASSTRAPTFATKRRAVARRNASDEAHRRSRRSWRSPRTTRRCRAVAAAQFRS